MNNREFDQHHIWHPNDSEDDLLACFEVIEASECTLTLDTGQTVIDLDAIKGSLVHGYNHPVLNQAAKDQIDTFSHLSFDGLTHRSAIQLTQKLLSMVPSGLSKVFYADSESMAVQIAVNMAVHYWESQGQCRKSKLLSLRNSYSNDLPAETYFTPVPQTLFDQTFSEDDILPLGEILEQHHNDIAALIIKPIVHCEHSMHFYSPEYLKRCQQLCYQYDLLLICDESLTGFGRTGKLFGCEYASITPDIICLGRTLTGGYAGLAAAICTEDVGIAVSRDISVHFANRTTHMANPYATAIACANLNLINQGQWNAQVAKIEQILKEVLNPCTGLEIVNDVRIVGGIGVVELKYNLPSSSIHKRLIEQGIWLRHVGKLLCITPPFVISEEQLRQIASGLYTVLSNVR